MSAVRKLAALMFALAATPALAAASPVAGSWQKMPRAPYPVLPGTSAWTGKQLLVFGRKPFSKQDVAEAYDPARRTWTTLAPPKGPDYVPGYTSTWTGKELLAFDPFYSIAYNPATNTWRKLHKAINVGLVAWTGREAIGWGGGCCGDAQSNGSAYNPATDSYRNLPRSPLAPSQSALGAWTGRELILFVDGVNPASGKPYPARFARAAAYNPATNAWRRIAPAPAPGGSAAWNGRELLVVGAGTERRAALAFNPSTNRWRDLAPLPSEADGGTAVWTGTRLLLWSSSRGFGYDPRTNRWSPLPRWPLQARGGSIVAWTGRSLIVWGGEIGTPVGTSTPPKFPLDGAAFTLAQR